MYNNGCNNKAAVAHNAIDVVKIIIRFIYIFVRFRPQIYKLSFIFASKCGKYAHCS